MHTHEVIENLQDLLLAMEGIESSSSGFALTGKESYLESAHPTVALRGGDHVAIGHDTYGEQDQNRQPERELHFPA